MPRPHSQAHGTLHQFIRRVQRPVPSLFVSLLPCNELQLSQLPYPGGSLIDALTPLVRKEKFAYNPFNKRCGKTASTTVGFDRLRITTISRHNRININLFNLDVGTTADDPSFFRDIFNDFRLLVPSTLLVLSGNNSRLLSWDVGDRILLNNLPDGDPAPDGSTLFSSVVAGRPSQLLENDVIGLDKEIASVTPITPAVDLVASVLPSSSSVQLGSAASAFATIMNAGTADATSCDITPLTVVPGEFVYQTTDPATNALTGTPNTPADIAAGGSQSYVFAFTPTAEIPPTEIELAFDCTNSDPAPVVPGLNTLLLSSSSTPVPDIVALAATPTGDGIVKRGGDIRGEATLGCGRRHEGATRAQPANY